MDEDAKRGLQISPSLSLIPLSLLLAGEMRRQIEGRVSVVGTKEMEFAESEYPIGWHFGAEWAVQAAESRECNRELPL